MTQSIFLRLLTSPIPAKGDDLRQQIAALNHGQPDAGVFQADPADFSSIPRTPFAYWIKQNIRDLYSIFERTEIENRIVRVSNETGDDYRFMRLWFEVNPHTIGQHRMWVPHAKGGSYRFYYSDLHLLVGWDDKRGTIRDYYGRPSRPDERVACANLFFRPGLTYPRRTNKFSIRALPAESTFSNKGAAVLVYGDKQDDLLLLLAVMNSSPYSAMIKLQAASTSFEVGTLQQTPFPRVRHDTAQQLQNMARQAYSLSRLPDLNVETSHVFCLPCLAAYKKHARSIPEAYGLYVEKTRIPINSLNRIRNEIDELVWEFYNLNEMDREMLLLVLREFGGQGNETNESEDDIVELEIEQEEEQQSSPDNSIHLEDSVKEYIQWCVGIAMGRWDIRFALNPGSLPALPGPFDPLPVCSPGMLAGPDGLPLSALPEGYPLPVAWDGLLVDDPGHPYDIVAAVRGVLGLLWQGRAEAIEAEACQILGVPDLRAWFRDPKGFFAYHIKRYSKSRRKAPIYWLLQSAKRSYGIWLYYPRLNPGSLFRAGREYADAKLNLEAGHLNDLQNSLAAAMGSVRKMQERKLAAQQGLVAELKAFQKALDAAALLELKPDLNDGVLLNIAPLHALVPWKEAENAWQELLRGKYDWSNVGQQLKQKGLVKG